MSFYATICAHLNYQDDESFDKAVSLLENDKYLEFQDGDGWIVDETGERITEAPNIQREDRTIEIPLFLHRNLSRLLDGQNLFFGAAGKAVWTSTDGCFAGGVIVNGEETAYDLDDWAKENGLAGDEPPPDSNADWEAWLEYSQEIEQAFFDEYGD